METLKIEEIESAGKTIENAKKLAKRIEAANLDTVNNKTFLEKKQKIASEHLNEISSYHGEVFIATKEYVNFIRTLFEKVIDVCFFPLKILIPIYIGLISLGSNAKEFINTDYAGKFTLIATIILLIPPVIIITLGFYFLKEQMQKVTDANRKLSELKVKNADIKEEILDRNLEFEHKMKSITDEFNSITTEIDEMEKLLKK